MVAAHSIVIDDSQFGNVNLRFDVVRQFIRINPSNDISHRYLQQC